MMGIRNLPPKPGHLDAHYEGAVVVARIRGPYDADVARYLESLYVAQATRYGYRLALLDARETTTITPEARRLMSEWETSRREPAAGAVIGASFAAKTIAGMLTRAIGLMTRAPVPLSFFDTEMEGRKWLDVQRIRFDELRRA